ncbi:MAG: phosphoribosylaminoimidazolesuccinocarboxamide synthase [Phycisphaeraceae bacterium]|nr:phosphoribosylaminoimidazolesuccinocarboxamide synthase [Phycisphaeraceae bacterium]
MHAAVDDALFRTTLPLPGRREGKVRDIYELPRRSGEAPRLLIVATDRISAFDVIMPTPIPGKGRLLTRLSLFWFRFLRARGGIPDHLLGDDVSEIPGVESAMRAALAGRSMICRAARVVPIECVVRGYLAGSGWSAYRREGRICGVPLPAGLQLADRLNAPIFTPATKATDGHDENISFEQAADTVGGKVMEQLRKWSIDLYRAAANHAASRGIILADTKFEFGFEIDADGQPSDRLMLIDEVLTPDSSRYWPADRWTPGREPPSFDKQFLRAWLLELETKGLWARTPPGPDLPREVVQGTLERYREALERLTTSA